MQNIFLHDVTSAWWIPLLKDSWYERQAIAQGQGEFLR